MIRHYRRKQIENQIRKLDMDTIEYVIYCRKSREESSQWQKQSLVDQLHSCIQYATSKWIQLAKENELTVEYFRNDEFTRWMESNSNAYEMEIMDKAKWLFYIIEQKSAKKPNNRPLRKQLIKLVKAWKIKGILSYAPDRQARNLIESWELVQLLDQQYLDVQYTNFSFENNESGRMILGINFVIAYNYSDRLSKNINRGKDGAIQRWKADGKYKYGYIINKEWYHEPDPEFFEVWKEAFRRKVYEYQSDEEIWKYITASWFKRKYSKNDRETPLNKKALYKIRVDEFNYGIMISGENQVDLRDINPYYEPLVTEDEFQVLLNRYLDHNKATLRPIKVIQEYEELMAFDNQFIIYDEKYGLTFNIPNRKRHYQRLDKSRVTNKNTTLADVIELNQIYYSNTVKVNGKQLSFTAETLVNTTYEYLKTYFYIDENIYEKYKEYHINEYEKSMKIAGESRRKLQLQLNAIMHQQSEFVKNFIKRSSVDDSKEIKQAYDQEIKSYQDKIDYIEEQLKNLWEHQRHVMFELETMIDMAKDLPEKYLKSKSVRKRKLHSLLFSNIYINNEMQVTYRHKPWLDCIFSKKSEYLEMEGLEPSSRHHTYRLLPW
jgi:DNA invertase Pin-like site-specific DNA recombinase